MMAPHMLSLAGPSFQATCGVSAAPEGAQYCWQLYPACPLHVTGMPAQGISMCCGWASHLRCPFGCRRVRHIVYSCVPRPDAKTARLRGAVEAAGGAWRDVLALSEADLAALVRADGVDILVDLTGHTANNRLGAFAMRPAPIQVSLLALSGVCELGQSLPIQSHAHSPERG